MAARKKISAREAAIKILTDQGNKAMNINEIAKQALPLTDLKGKNPIHGIRVQLVVGSNREKGAFERTAKGMYRVRPSFLKDREAKAAAPKEEPKKQAAKKNNGPKNNGPKEAPKDEASADLKEAAAAADAKAKEAAAKKK